MENKNIKVTYFDQISHSSFRDPSGFIFYRDNTLYRQVTKSYKENYELLMNSGLYKSLVDLGLMIPHEEVDVNFSKSENAYKIIKPEQIPFISYPYEWCFSQLKDAALATLKIQKTALSFGMTLKDCSAYNIQFRKCKPILIDTLSFDKYSDLKPWVAPYRQFCRHFLAPLALMTYTNISLNRLLQIYIDGIPLDLASSLLPLRTYFKKTLFYHIHVSTRLQKYFVDKPLDKEKFKMDKKALLNLIGQLESSIKKMEWTPEGTEWSDYYSPDCSNYSKDAFEHKKQLVEKFLKMANPSTLLDLGANIGEFSRIAGNIGIMVISADNDPSAVEKNYRESVNKGENNILPLLIDLTNPSPDIGWDNKERVSFLKRRKADAAMALALVHHLAISNNLPLEKIASFFYKICSYLIVEFVPKTDSNVKRILSRREDIFPDYKQESFEGKFEKYFDIIDSQKIKNSERVLYLMKTKV